MKDKYSVVTTVFNDRNEVEKLIKDMEKQTVLPTEMIIVDGGSKDDTVEIVKDYSKHCSFQLRIISGERLNIAQGFNRGIKEAQCDYIGIIACGNKYPNNFFEVLLSDLQKNEEIYVSYGAIRGLCHTRFAKNYSKINMGEVFLEKFPTNHGNLCRKELFDREGYFYESFQYAGEDQEYFVKIVSKGYGVFGDEHVVIEWEVPQNIHTYIKQQKGYVVSDLEMFDNRTVYKIYKKRIMYVLCWMLMIFFLFIPKGRIIGGIFLGWILYRMIKNIIKYDYGYVFAYNVFQFVPVLELVKNCKFLLRKNKMSSLLNRYY